MIEVGARRLGGDVAHAPAAGRALGLVNWLMAVPALRAAGRQPLPEGVDIVDLAEQGLAAWHEVRRGFRTDLAAMRSTGRAAYFPLAGFGKLLGRAARDPAAIEDDHLDLGPFEARLRLALTVATGRLW